MGATPSALAFRLSLFYVAYFTVVGVHLPFWPVWLADRGLDARAIGDIVTVSIVARVFTAPVIASFADRRGERKRVIVALAVASLACFMAFRWSHGFLPILAVSLLFTSAWAGLMPLGENMTLSAATTRGLDYGRIRLWGSVAFIAVSAATGSLLVGRNADTIFLLLAAALVLLLLVTLALPTLEAPRPPALARSPMRALLGDRRFLLFLAACVLVQSSHGLYYVMGTLHWESVGHSADVIGALWAEGVIAEIVLFLFAARLLRVLDPASLVVLGGLAGVVRWIATGATDDLLVLALVQPLHGFTYGAAHLGAMHYISRTVPAAMAVTAQSLYGSVAMGAGMGLATFASGRLYGAVGGDAYHVMAVLCGLGAAAALLLRRQLRVSAATGR